MNCPVHCGTARFGSVIFKWKDIYACHFNGYFWKVCLLNKGFHGVIFLSIDNVGVINQQYINKKVEFYLVKDPMAKKVMCDN